ncbi:MAG: YARHG domain-containing protein [bacterium]
MKFTIVSIILLFSLINLYSNDDPYIESTGGILYPMKQTRISIKKELLSFYCNEDTTYGDMGGYANVKVNFDFFNPDDTTIKTLVGFAARGEDVKNFIIKFEGKKLTYKKMSTDNIDSALTIFDPLSSKNLYIIYLFEVPFKPGLNKIEHSYDFLAVNQFGDYEYVLTTGAKWAGEKIGQLTIDLTMNNSKFLEICSDSLITSEFKTEVIGKGKFFFDRGFLCSYILDGKLRLTTVNYRPKKDLMFNNKIIPIMQYFNDTELNEFDFEIFNALNRRNLECFTQTITLNDLNLIENGIYAEYGYDITDAKIKSIFSKVPWYSPNLKLKLKDIKLNSKDKVFLKQVLVKKKQLLLNDNKKYSK